MDEETLEGGRVFMSHIDRATWTAYVRQTLSEPEQVSCEDHLYACDSCLQLYLEVVDIHENELPIIQNEEMFTTMVMSQVSKKQPPSTRFDQKLFVHYVLAAAATILLMLSGVFQSITSYVDTVQSPVTTGAREPSLTDHLMERTFSWVDSVEMKLKEERK